MSSSVFPSLPGLSWPVTRTAEWQTRKPVAVSGKETAIADWSYPRYQWDLVFDVLRQGTVNGDAFAEMQTLFAFYNARSGGGDSFLYEDAYDNAVTGQSIGAGDGSTKVFQLVRAFGGYVEPVLAPHAVSNVYLDGVADAPANYTVNPWDTSDANGPGVIVFASAPGSGVAITADFSFYWPCRFDIDQCEFGEMMQGFFEVKKLTFKSIK